MKQKTIKNTVSCSGVGIHTGKNTTLTINPAPENHGIVFIRTDHEPRLRIPAIWENIKSALNASTLGVNGTRIGTVEHLLAALAAMEIDNAEIEFNEKLFKQMCGDAEQANVYTYLLWITHNLERIGDRITNIAERVVYLVTNVTPELNR